MLYYIQAEPSPVTVYPHGKLSKDTDVSLNNEDFVSRCLLYIHVDS